MRCVESFVSKCVESGYISCNKAPWLTYALEKRISSVIITIPLLFLGTKISSISVAIAFYVSSRSIRSYTNGVHAKSLIGCFCGSIICEICFLGIFRSILTVELKIIFMLVSLILIWLLAPYNHPNMGLSDIEITGLRNSSRKIALSEQCCIVISWLMGFSSITRGLTTGVAMAAFLLSLAYVNDWRKVHENQKRSNS